MAAKWLKVLIGELNVCLDIKFESLNDLEADILEHMAPF